MKSAVLSEDNNYRYQLSRIWVSNPLCYQLRNSIQKICCKGTEGARLGAFAKYSKYNICFT